ncbi:hypothetical protein FB567DRAFT_564578 [Paraphoma chrysanthemicola]|uniref:DUF3533 domain-containing protein n=1 Tax=Paraphoma chrysanthemicola TaxID=798071 RepID=A0A8K0QUD8_9PLEO|nr:hypothetical protein FB567DRAFT_564578 [Paraphoma chrysanthemicola]
MYEVCVDGVHGSRFLHSKVVECIGRVGSSDSPTAHLGAKTTGTQRPNVNLKEMLKGLVIAGFMIMAVFWVNLSHIYGLFFNQGAYVKRAHVALADFDGGDFGNALRIAAASNNGSYNFPTYVNVGIAGTTPEEIRNQVFDGKYWAAIIVEPGASARFDRALNGTAPSYNASAVYTYYLLTARYYALYAGGIQSSTITTASTATGIFSKEYATPRVASGEFANTTAAASALAVPARAVGYSAGPLDYSTLDNKALLNTIGAVMPILMQFFFIMAWNGICNGMHLYAAYNLRTHVLARLFWSILWPLLSSLCSAGWTFAFRGSYRLDAKMFFAFWTVTWVYSMISFDMLDIITGFVPMAFVPFLMVSWVIFNVAASLGDPTMLLGTRSLLSSRL